MVFYRSKTDNFRFRPERRGRGKNSWSVLKSVGSIWFDTKNRLLRSFTGQKPIISGFEPSKIEKKTIICCFNRKCVGRAKMFDHF